MIQVQAHAYFADRCGVHVAVRVLSEVPWHCSGKLYAGTHIHACVHDCVSLDGQWHRGAVAQGGMGDCCTDLGARHCG